jgi:hypothetical protein
MPIENIIGNETPKNKKKIFKFPLEKTEPPPFTIAPHWISEQYFPLFLSRLRASPAVLSM